MLTSCSWSIYVQGMLTRRQAGLAAKQEALERTVLLNAEDLESDSDNEGSREDSQGKSVGKATLAKKVCFLHSTVPE